MRSQTVQAIQAEFRENFDLPAGFIEVSIKNPSDRTYGEQFLRVSWFFRTMRVYENQWYQYSQGFLDEELFQGYQQHLRITLSTDDYRQLWDFQKDQGFFHPGFVTYVDSFISQNPSIPYSVLDTR